MYLLAQLSFSCSLNLWSALMWRYTSHTVELYKYRRNNPVVIIAVSTQNQGNPAIGISEHLIIEQANLTLANITCPKILRTWPQHQCAWSPLVLRRRSIPLSQEKLFFFCSFLKWCSCCVVREWTQAKRRETQQWFALLGKERQGLLHVARRIRINIK